jgi:hypothetical protein
MNPTTRHCIGLQDSRVNIPEHDVPWDEKHLAPWAMDGNRKNIRCRDCDREYRRSRAALKSGTSAPAVRKQVAELRTVRFSDDLVPESEVSRSHEYIPNPELVQLWQSIVVGTIDHGDPPANLVFFGPSGSGKTDGAAYLAAMVGLPFTKVDAASMTDPESWFGSREIIPENGVSVTKYVPSAMVEALQKPGVLFVDEFNRVDDEHRNVWLPLTDGTGRVTNPLTGEVLNRHPHCFIIMAGNRGLQFTGTSAIDPAFTSRALTIEFEYLDSKAEQKVAMDATGCSADDAACFVLFANESRKKHVSDPDFTPISTREVIAACRRTARGLSRDLAAKFAIINAASDSGGDGSIRRELQSIWNGVRVTKAEVEKESSDPTGDSKSSWVCPVHNRVKTVQAGISKAGLPFKAFNACPVAYCEETEDRRGAVRSAAQQPSNTLVTCTGCGTVQAPGRQTFCASCGATL